MDELGDILRPAWGSEHWILEGWNAISVEEKALIKNRMQALFAYGLPIELKHDRLIYIYTFSLLAQLEVLAIQVPLKFESRLSKPEHKQMMRAQLLDEIFHGMVFTKLLYMLCAPNAYPPAYNSKIEVLCNFIRGEDCPQIALMLLNLVAEGWIEEIFYSLERAGVAPKVFEAIIADEHRHVSEADLYREIGLPDKEEMTTKLAFLEEQLLTNIFLQYKYMYSVSALLGVEGTQQFIASLDNKHTEQLKKIDLTPSENWSFFLRFNQELLPSITEYSKQNVSVPMTPIRKTLMTQWNHPSDPAGACDFNLNVSRLEFFSKKYPPQILTPLLLQTVSATLLDIDALRVYLCHNNLYRSDNAYVGLVVILPGCDDQMGFIVFENCHEWSASDLAARIRSVMRMMMYCYKKRERLEQEHPHLLSIMENAMHDYTNKAYKYPVPGSPFVSVSNIGAYGWSQAFSPLRATESLKFTCMAVERRSVWNNETKLFEPQDLLPITVTADHRYIDGNLPVPKYAAINFEKMLDKMVADQAIPTQPPALTQKMDLVQAVDEMVERNLELTYKTLLFLQTCWLEFYPIEELLSQEFINDAKAAYNKAVSA